MFVMVVGRGYPSKKYTLNGIFEYDQAKALARNNCKVVYISIDLRSFRRWRRWGIHHFENEKIEVYELNIPCGGFPDNLIYRIAISSFRRLYNIIKKEHGEPDIIHAHFLNNGFIIANLIDDINSKFIITEHLSSMHKDNIEKKMLNYAEYAYNKADVLLAVSPSLLKNIKTKLGITMRYIPNVVDTSIFVPSPKIKHKDFCIVSVGGLIYEKRMDLLIKAFAGFAKEVDNIMLIIFGEGPEKGKLEKLIKDYELSNKVLLKGQCSRKEISIKMLESDLFILVSQSETFGVAYIEAMSAGLPVIATKCGGPESFVNSSNGLLIPINDLEATTNAIKYMYNNIYRYDCIKVSKDIRNLFSPESISNQLIEIYKQII